MQPDDDQVGELKRSRTLVGELLPVVVDQTGRVLNGRHRRRAGWRSTVTVSVSDELDFLVKRLHFLVQRRSSQAEHAEAFAAICAELERRGMEAAAIAEHVVARISPFEKSYTYALVQERFKSARAARYGQQAEAPTVGTSPPFTSITDASGVVIRQRTGAAQQQTVSCPNCFTPLRIVAGRLELA